MLRSLLAFAAALAGATGLAATTEEIKVDLKSFQWKPAFEKGTELGGYDEGENRFFFHANGTAAGDVTIPDDGEYTITIEASCSAAQKELAKFKLSVGDVVVAKEHLCTAEEAKKYTFTAKLKRGKQPLAIAFLNDVFKEGEYDRNLFVYSVKVEKK
jgi:predicted xylan-binding protein with Ca-dependent carbohydrate-binding module